MAKLVTEAVLHPNEQYYYICPTRVQAKSIVWTAPNMIKRLVPEAAVESYNAQDLIIFLKNGAQIHIKGADDPDSLRGMNPKGVILDEFAQMKPEVYTEVLLPVLIANNGWCWIMGTPKGKNHFYKMFKMAQNAEAWSAFHLPASTTGVLSQLELQEAKNSMIDKLFRQEFECEWFDDAGSVFRRITENIKNTLKDPVYGREYVVGVDLARHVDYTVICVADAKTREVVYIDRFNQLEYSTQKAKIEAVTRRYNNARLIIDSTGVGDPIAADLEDAGLNVEQFHFTNSTKKDLIENLILMLEQDKIKIPDVDYLLEELRNFTYELSRTGRAIYGAPDGMHDDAVIALALAVWGLPKGQFATYDILDQQQNQLKYNQYGEPVYD